MAPDSHDRTGAGCRDPEGLELHLEWRRRHCPGMVTSLASKGKGKDLWKKADSEVSGEAPHPCGPQGPREQMSWSPLAWQGHRDQGTHPGLHSQPTSSPAHTHPHPQVETPVLSFH